MARSIKSILKPRVNRGVKLLDDKFPGWLNKIDLKLLDMGSLSRCVLGQLYNHSGYLTNLNKIGIETYREGEEYGFGASNINDKPGGVVERDDLTQVWREKITELRSNPLLRFKEKVDQFFGMVGAIKEDGFGQPDKGCLLVYYSPSGKELVTYILSFYDDEWHVSGHHGLNHDVSRELSRLSYPV